MCVVIKESAESKRALFLYVGVSDSCRRCCLPPCPSCHQDAEMCGARGCGRVCLGESVNYVYVVSFILFSVLFYLMLYVCHENKIKLRTNTEIK